ncbi:hypothetical protein MHYP_G00192370 [Metynnis hypsauchen]
MNSAGQSAPGGGGLTRSSLLCCPFKGAVLAGRRANGDRRKAWLPASAGKFERSFSMTQLSEKAKDKLQAVHALNTLMAINFIGWLRQVRPRRGGFLQALKEEVLRLDLSKRKEAKFRPPRWPPVISIMERELRKRARKEILWVRRVEAAAARDPQLSSRRSRPHTHSGGRQKEGEGSGASAFRPPHWPPVISAAKKAKRQLFLEELERAQAAQAKQKPEAHCTGGRRLRRRTKRSCRKQAVAVRFQLDSPATSVDSQRGLSLAI